MLQKLILLFISSLLLACRPSSSEQVVLQGQTMGTHYTIKYLTPTNSVPEKDKIQQEINDALAEVNRQMSTYQTDSEISQFNTRTSAQQRFTISDDFATVISEAIALNQLTEGALDITIGPLVNLWGFGSQQTLPSAPTTEQLAQAKQITGIDKLHFQAKTDNSPATISKNIDGMFLDLSSIAKGFGVDKVAQYLDKQGIQHYLIEIGGELRAKGHNAQGETWKVGIEQPSLAQQQNSQVIIPLNNQALATSGDYRNFRLDEQGKRLSHIINPKTQHPINHRLASVSVVSENAMRADGMATGLYVLGEEKALQLAEQHQLAVLLIIYTDQGFESKMSTAFQQLLKTP